MGGMAVIFWQKENRLLEERYLNVAMMRSYLETIRQGWAPDLKNHMCYCIEYYRAKMKTDKISFISSPGFHEEGKC